MSKIGRYQNAKSVAMNVREAAIGAKVTCSYEGVAPGSWNPFNLKFRTGGVGHADFVALGKYLARAITVMGPEIMARAAELAEAEAEDARLAAVDEAKEVLQAAEPES